MWEEEQRTSYGDLQSLASLLDSQDLGSLQDLVCLPPLRLKKQPTYLLNWRLKVPEARNCTKHILECIKQGRLFSACSQLVTDQVIQKYRHQNCKAALSP